MATKGAKTTATVQNISNYTGSNGAVYGLGFIGSIVYYFQHADTFGMFIIGILKAAVWPAIFIYKFLESLA